MGRPRGHLGQSARVRRDMYWEEDKAQEPPEVGDEVVDLAFAMECRALPVDHAWALSQALLGALPWLADEPLAGIHSIHGAATGNGWVRPEDPAALLQLSRRTRLTLRLPGARVDEARAALEGNRLMVAGQPLGLKQATARNLSTQTTLFSRHLAAEKAFVSEEALLDWVAEQLTALDIRPRKLLCGTSHDIGTPQGDIATRSLMVADLEYDEAIRLQQAGIGPHRLLGCGLFIPHKGIQSLSG